MAQEGKLYQTVLDAGKVSADQVTTLGQGGGNVTESVGNVISIAGKIGLGKEEMPMLLLQPGHQTKDRCVFHFS